MIIETGWDIASAAVGWSDTISKASSGDGWGAVGAGLGAVVDTAAVFVPGVPGGASMARRGLEAVAGSMTKAERIAANAAQGARGEAATAAKLGDKTAGRQVTFKTSDGTRTRADFVTKDKGVVETKTGGAQLTTGQQKLFNDVSAGRPVTPVGKNAEAAGLEPGRPTNMKSCQVDRPC